MRPERSGGFTLLELIVVLGLAALVLALTLPRLSGGLEGLRVRAASRQVAATLRAARALAIAERKVVTVTVDPGQGGLQMRSGSDARPRQGLTLPPGVGLAILDERGRPQRSRTIQIRFSLRGGSEGAYLGVTGAGRLIPITVEPLTGRVTIL